jgi:hypothetical protein
MSNLTKKEKNRFEHLLDMRSGYVLDFSNATFEHFIFESTGRSIYDPQYNYGTGSKANRLRGFWNEESNYTVGKLMADLLEYGNERELFQNKITTLEACQQIVVRLSHENQVPELNVLTEISSEKDFEVIAKEVREIIERNQPEVGLDRLHTFVTKYIRSLCNKRGITVVRDKALHSLFGQYVKRLREDGHIESEMTERILKSSISLLEAFNHVRNEQSLAHDNPLLNYEEALLIFNNIVNAIRFLRDLETKLGNREQLLATHEELDNKIPF